MAKTQMEELNMLAFSLFGATMPIPSNITVSLSSSKADAINQAIYPPVQASQSA